MSNYDTTYDLVSGVLSRCGELTARGGVSDYEATALQYINKAHLSVLAGGNEMDVNLGEPWVWGKAQNPGVIVLKAPYATGTVSVVNGSTSATLSTLSANSLAGNYLKINGRADYIRIASHTAGTTALVLDAGYSDETGSGLSFSSYQLDYPLVAGVLRLIAPMRVYQSQSGEADDQGRIEGIDATTLGTDFPLHRLISGVPTKYAQVYKDTTGKIWVRFNKVVQSDTRVEYDYIPIPADLTDSALNYPLVPREHRISLELVASFYLMVDKDDNRAAVLKGLAQSALQALVNANKREQKNQSRTNLGRIIPRADLSESSRRYVTQEVGS